MLEIKNVTVKFKEKVVLDNLSLKLPDVGLVTLSGKSGVGKSTFLNLIAGLIKNYEGKVIFEANFKKERDLFYNQVETNLFSFLTVKENFKIFLDDKEFKEALEYINKYELNYLINRKVELISSGEKNRINLIIALVKKAKIILLDEPLANVDIETKPLLLKEIEKLSEKALVIVCHHLEESDELKINIEEKEKQTNTIEKGKRKLLLNSLVYNLNKSRKVPLIYHLTLYLILIIALVAFLVFNTKKEELYKNGLLKNDVTIIVQDPIKIKTNNTGYYQTLDYEISSETYNDERVNFSHDKLIITDKLCTKGTKTKLEDDTIYISDYLYQLTSNNGYLALDGPSIDLPYGLSSIMLVSNYHIQEVNVKSSFLDSRNNKINFNEKKLKLAIYETNFKEFLREEAPDSRTVLWQAQHYYFNVYMNKNTLENITTDSEEFPLYFDDNALFKDNVDDNTFIFKDPKSFLNYASLEYKDIYEKYYNEKNIKPLMEALKNKEFTFNFEYDDNIITKTLVNKTSNFNYHNYNSATRTLNIGISPNLYNELLNAYNFVFDTIKYQGRDIYFIDIDDPNFFENMEQIMNDNFLFLNQKHEINELLTNFKKVQKPFKIIFYALISLALVSYICYFIFYLIPDFKKLKYLKLRSYTYKDIFILNYLPSILIEIIYICLLFSLASLIVGPLKVLLKIV